MTERSSHQAKRGVELRCEDGHVVRGYFRGMTLEMAEEYAHILDGSDPRTDPANTWIGRCVDCGKRFTAKPFGYGPMWRALMIIWSMFRRKRSCVRVGDVKIMLDEPGRIYPHPWWTEARVDYGSFEDGRHWLKW